MRLLNICMLFFSALLPMKSYGQFTLDELIPGGKNYPKYIPDMPKQVRWYGDKLSYAKGDSLFLVSPKTLQAEVFITLQQINKALTDSSLQKINNLAGVIDFSYKTGEMFISNGKEFVLLNVADKSISGKFEKMPNSKNHDFSFNSHSLFYTKGNNLYLLRSDGKEMPISRDESDYIIYGQSVHRNEFGINKGIFRSPSENKIAFYRMDESMVTDYPLVNASTRIATLDAIKYPMAGMKSHHVTVGVYDIDRGTTVYFENRFPKRKISD